MTILVTGAGLIGCHTARLLIENGQSVVLLDNNPSQPAISSILGDKLPPIERIDIRDLAAIQAVIARHRVTRVLHTAAALSLAFNANPPMGAAVNILGTVNLLEASRQAGISRFVFGSSTTVAYSTFHRPAAMPIVEDFDMKVVEDRPGSFYAASKLSAEYFIQLYADRYDMSVGILRYAAVLGLWAGPNNSVPGRLIESLLAQSDNGVVSITDPFLLWSGGDDFIDARDVARANVAALEAASLPTRVYYIASGRLTTLREFVEAARQIRPDVAIQMPPPPATGFAGFPHLRAQPFDIGAAQRDLAFCPECDLVSSLRDAYRQITISGPRRSQTPPTARSG